ncbi:MAG: hypothetical protein K1X67_00370 [Fimbriimonadaceae bacterium]|nr:hypothetical protein [Fimbriimonadaceae bacterium]
MSNSDYERGYSAGRNQNGGGDGCAILLMLIALAATLIFTGFVTFYPVASTIALATGALFYSAGAQIAGPEVTVPYVVLVWLIPVLATAAMFIFFMRKEFIWAQSPIYSNIRHVMRIALTVVDVMLLNAIFTKPEGAPNMPLAEKFTASWSNGPAWVVACLAAVAVHIILTRAPGLRLAWHERAEGLLLKAPASFVTVPDSEVVG